MFWKLIHKSTIDSTPYCEADADLYRLVPRAGGAPGVGRCKLDPGLKAPPGFKI